MKSFAVFRMVTLGAACAAMLPYLLDRLSGSAVANSAEFAMATPEPTSAPGNIWFDSPNNQEVMYCGNHIAAVGRYQGNLDAHVWLTFIHEDGDPNDTRNAVTRNYDPTIRVGEWSVDVFAEGLDLPGDVFPLGEYLLTIALNHGDQIPTESHTIECVAANDPRLSKTDKKSVTIR